MNEIRAFAADDAAEVANLYLKVMRGQDRAAGPALGSYFREIFLDNPWVCDDIPSLVYRCSGKLIGFIGVLPRSMSFGGRPIRVAVTSQFMVDPDHRRGGLPALELLKRTFSGPQDLCYSDGSADASHIVWTGAGGCAARLYSFTWLRPLRLMKTAATFMGRDSGRSSLLGAALRPLVSAGDFALSKAPHPFFRPMEPQFHSKTVTPQELFECIQDVGWHDPLHPAYERDSFQWLLTQAAGGGRLTLSAVQNPANGVLCGWYVYRMERDGSATVLQIGVRRRDQFGEVFASVVSDAWRAGASFLKGQAIPQCLVSLSNHKCLFRQMNTSAVFQTRDPKLETMILRGQAALSWLDGESWMQFSQQEWA